MRRIFWDTLISLQRIRFILIYATHAVRRITTSLQDYSRMCMKTHRKAHLVNMSYETKYRSRAIQYHKEGNSIRKTAKIFGISTNTLSKWLKQQRESGELKRKYRTYKTAISEDELLSYLQVNPSAYQSEIGEHFGCDQSVVCRTLKRFKITRKKR